MKTISKALLGAALLTPGIALADANNFNFAELQYLLNESDGFDMDGWAVNGSLELTEQVFATALYAAVDLDENLPFIRDIEAEQFDLGLGYVFRQTSTYNVFGVLEYNRQNVDVRAVNGSFDEDDDGFTLGLGSRYNLSAQTELRVQVNYTDLADDDDFVPMVGLVHKFTPQFAAVAEYRHNDSNSNNLSLGVRFYY